MRVNKLSLALIAALTNAQAIFETAKNSDAAELSELNTESEVPAFGVNCELD